LRSSTAKRRVGLRRKESSRFSCLRPRTISARSELTSFRCLNATLRTVFPQVVALPGETVHFLAARPGRHPHHGSGGARRAAPRAPSPDEATSASTSCRSGCLLTARSTLQQQIEPQASTPLNSDFAPRGYFLDVELASARFHRGQSEWLAALERIKFRTTLVIVLVGMLALSLLARRSMATSRGPATQWQGHIPSSGKRASQHGGGMCVTAMGFTH